MTRGEDPTLPWYGIDNETGEQHFGPVDEEEAIVRRNDHPRHEHIVLQNQPAGQD